MKRRDALLQRASAPIGAPAGEEAEPERGLVALAQAAASFASEIVEPAAATQPLAGVGEAAAQSCLVQVECMVPNSWGAGALQSAVAKTPKKPSVANAIRH